MMMTLLSAKAHLDLDLQPQWLRKKKHWFHPEPERVEEERGRGYTWRGTYSGEGRNRCPSRRLITCPFSHLQGNVTEGRLISHDFALGNIPFGTVSSSLWLDSEDPEAFSGVRRALEVV